MDYEYTLATVRALSEHQLKREPGAAYRWQPGPGQALAAAMAAAPVLPLADLERIREWERATKPERQLFSAEFRAAAETRGLTPHQYKQQVRFGAKQNYRRFDAA